MADNKSKLQERFGAVLKVSVKSIIANVLLAGFKAVAGFISGSIAITMDAVNNFTDAGSSLITILGTFFAKKAPDKKHPFGHGRSEYLATLLISGLILYAGITAVVESVSSIIEGGEATYETVTIVITVVALFVKLFLGIYVQKAGKKLDSDALVASGKDALGDSLISLTTIIAIILSLTLNISIEGWLGAAIGLFIVKTGIETLQETISKILGEGAEIELVQSIKKKIKEHDGVVGAYDLVINNYGPDRYLASVHIEVEDTMTLHDLDLLTRHLEKDILEEYGVLLTAIGMYSINTKDEEIIASRKKVSEIVHENQYVKQMHGFFYDVQSKLMRFDLVISFDAGDRRAVYEEAVSKVTKEYPGVDIVVGMDIDFNELQEG